MTDDVQIQVKRFVRLMPLEIPDTVFQQPELPGLQGVNLPLNALGADATNAIIEDFLNRFYKAAQVTNPWTKKAYR